MSNEIQSDGAESALATEPSGFGTKMGNFLVFLAFLGTIGALTGYTLGTMQVVSGTGESGITVVSGPFLTLVTTVVAVLSLLFKGWTRSVWAKRLIVVVWLPVVLAAIAAGVLAVMGY